MGFLEFVDFYFLFIWIIFEFYFVHWQIVKSWFFENFRGRRFFSLSAALGTFSFCWSRAQTVITVTHKEISLKDKGVLATSVRVFNLIPTLNISARDKTKFNYLVANCPESLSWQEGIFFILKTLKITFHIPINDFFFHDNFTLIWRHRFWPWTDCVFLEQSQSM